MGDDLTVINKPELVLGTAQLGLDYGITNRHGKPDVAQAGALLSGAYGLGIRTLDTARAYGTSEAVIGRFASRQKAPESFTVLTKTTPDLAEKGTVREILDALHASLRASRDALNTQHLNCVMLHRPEHMTIGGGVVMDFLRNEVERGHIGRIGVSLSDPEELVDVLDDPFITHVQFPFNLLDHRFEREDILKRLQNRSDVRVHVRSVFLQGLIVDTEPSLFEKRFGMLGVEIDAFLKKLPEIVKQSSRLHAALSYVRSMEWIDGIVVGTASLSELEEIAAASHIDIDKALVSQIRQHRPLVDVNILNPAKWPQN